MIKTAIFSAIAGIILISCQGTNNRTSDTFDYGRIKDSVYINDYFKLIVHIPHKWHIQSQDQIKEMAQKGDEMINDENLKRSVKASEVNVAYLLSIFKYEVGAPVESNPSLIIVAENIKAFPGIKSGKDYLFHAKKLLQQTSVQYTFTEPDKGKKIGGREFDLLIANAGNGIINIEQQYLSTVLNNFSLSFILTYTNDDEKNELLRILNNISFN